MSGGVNPGSALASGGAHSGRTATINPAAVAAARRVTAVRGDGRRSGAGVQVVIALPQ
ncbi:Uncharacterised protein [Mycobacteroides abscessus subsp. abscessus]|nr:Uncharacterised protein [Mycobacteroides abscessus subsp. abscessus]